MPVLDKLKERVSRSAEELCAEKYGGNASAMARDLDLGQSQVSRIMNRTPAHAESYAEFAEAVYEKTGDVRFQIDVTLGVGTETPRPAERQTGQGYEGGSGHDALINSAHKVGSAEAVHEGEGVVGEGDATLRTGPSSPFVEIRLLGETVFRLDLIPHGRSDYIQLDAEVEAKGLGS